MVITVDEKKVMRELMTRLRMIYDNKDFVCGTISIARDASVWQEILNCIDVFEEEGEPISSDDILSLALVLRREADKKEIDKTPRNKVVASM